MISLSNLKPAKGAVKNRKRVGRGYGSGSGKTAGRGSKGAKSRTGYSRKRGFEGGQMPLVRRIPKRGFTNIYKTEYNIINIGILEKTNLAEIKLEDFFARRLAKNKNAGIKILGNGELTRSITVHAHHFSRSAAEKIKKAGGQAIILNP